MGNAPAPPQNLVRTGALYADGLGNVTGHTQTTIKGNAAGTTELVDYRWTGTYSLNPDLTGTLSVTPVATSSWICTDMTVPEATTCSGTEVGPESYAISLSVTQEVLNMVETDNFPPTSTNPSGGGGKIFMTGRALKR